MISGEITALLDPVIECILLSKRAEHTQIAVIDTGFNGFLSAPDTLLVSMGWLHLGYEKYEIATGEVVRQRIYLGRIRFIGLEQEVVAVASHAKDVLIGTRLLDVNRCIINMDFPNRRLQIKRSRLEGSKD